MKKYKMIVLDGKVPLNNIILNNINLLKEYINNNNLGTINVSIDPKKTAGVIIFEAGPESVTNGFNLYATSLANEMQMDNGMAYIVDNDTSEYDLNQFRNIVERLIPEMKTSVEKIIGYESATEVSTIPDITYPFTPTAGVETDEEIIKEDINEDNIPNTTTVTTNMIYQLLTEVRDLLKTYIQTTPKNPQTDEVQTPAIPDTQIPETIKKENIDPNLVTTATEVATPNEVSVPDNNIVHIPNEQASTSSNVEEVTTKPEVNTQILDQNVDATTPTTGIESNEYPDGDLGDIIRYIDKIKPFIPGLENCEAQEAENLINNYIISNVSTVSDHIIDLFNNYFFIESKSTMELKPLDRVTKVRRELNTNKYI